MPEQRNTGADLIGVGKQFGEVLELLGGAGIDERRIELEAYCVEPPAGYREKARAERVELTLCGWPDEEWEDGKPRVLRNNTPCRRVPPPTAREPSGVLFCAIADPFARYRRKF